ALQETLSNFFSGIYLIFDRPFKTGDVITLGSGHTGTVLEVGTRSAKIKTFDNTIVTIPNAELAKSIITNLSAPDSIIRVKLPISVAYGSNINQVKQLLEDVTKEDPAVVGDPQPAARFMKFGDFSLDFELMLWVDSLGKKLDTIHRINTSINDALEKAGIEIPFPTRTLYNVMIDSGKSNQIQQPTQVQEPAF
ncbi:MAG: mechanosensitive ion channel family protein, partial [Candidatus Aenigmatarchaeota archaeon]